MAEVHVCDRCGDQVRRAALRRFLHLRSLTFGTRFELCEKCSMELVRWLGTPPSREAVKR